jgi:S1-C subfamily serine protease
MNKTVFTVWTACLLFFVGLGGMVIMPLGSSTECGFEDAVVKIEMPNGGHGTGFVVHKSGVIMTAAHLFWDRYGDGNTPIEGTVVFKDGREYEFTFGYAPEERGNGTDFAFIKIDVEEDLPIIPVFDASKSVSPGSKVYIIGMPRQERWHWSFGYIAGTVEEGEEDYELDLDINPGNSGGPLIWNGKVIGIVARYVPYTDISYATLINDEILDALNAFIKVSNGVCGNE